MKFRHTMVAASLAALAFASAPASATVTVQIKDIVGQWQFAVPVPPTTTITNGTPTSIVSWGTPAFPNTTQSQYQFTNGADLSITLLPPVDSGPELFGTFAHLNFPIFCAAAGCLSSVELKVTADIVVAGQDEGTKTFVFDFSHDETPNGGPPGGPFTGTCPFPVPGSPNGVPGPNINGCADHVTVTNSNSSQTFTVGGVNYTFSFLGFSQNGGVTITNDFLTTENQTNIAGLYAQVVTTEVPTAPEPGSLALVGLAALGVAGALRRRSQK
jgi:hypothetical protein